MFDLTTGALRWTVPDPGFEPTAMRQRRTIVAGDRVVVGGVLESEASRWHVTVVFDRESGRELQRYRGGAGADWVVVIAGRDGQPALEFHR
ncbi:hypothetical protein [Nocardia xishanensis]|uniref:PQQ-binding-like beta-propeller repeat protein n=1 Tax=Nocardia xishanensis TaxID=238964 RepID=A0ABW7XBI7_9NOCA